MNKKCREKRALLIWNSQSVVIQFEARQIELISMVSVMFFSDWVCTDERS